MRLDCRTTTLPNGVRFYTEHVPAVSSAALGIWVGTGSREEKASENGAAHFIEHMLFKGTSTHTAREMAQRMDAIGGQMNAFTTKECTCFYGRALNTHLGEAADILCSMFFDAKFAEEDVQTERGVILEEIGMYADDPADLVMERMSAAIYKGSSLARPILGKKSTLEKMTGQWLKEYKQSHYTPDRVVVSLAGSFEDAFVEELMERFAAMEQGHLKPSKPAVYHPAMTLKRKATEQNHLLLTFPSISDTDPRRFPMQLLSSILGGGMSSRLFQEVRERQGLCYNVYTYGSGYQETGTFSIDAALNKETEMQALSAIRQVVEQFTQDGVTEQELNRVRELAKANVLMGLESTTARMNSMARAALRGEKVRTEEEIIAAYDAVTAEEIRTLAQETFQWTQCAFSAVGKVDTEEHYHQIIHAL